MYILDTDASGDSIGAVLSQIQDQQERVICFGSRVCSLAEQNYDVTRRELLAIVYFLKTFRHYLFGRKFLLRTDHSALQWLRRTPLPIGQQARWLSVIEEFEFEIVHRPGASHLNADAMSRRPQHINAAKESPRANDPTPTAVLEWDKDVLAEEQRSDEDLGWLIQRLGVSTEMPSCEEVRALSATVKTLTCQWPQLVMRDGLLNRRWMMGNDEHTERLQLVLPPGRRSPLIQLVHTGPSGGHLGISRTAAQVQRRAYWPGWRADVQIELRRCTQCSRYFRGKVPRQSHLQDMVVGEPMECLGIDVTGPHPV